MNLRLKKLRSEIFLPPKDETSTWLTGEGIKLFVYLMDDSHIKNCVRMLNRNIDNIKSYMKNKTVKQRKQFRKNTISKIKVFEDEQYYRKQLKLIIEQGL